MLDGSDAVADWPLLNALVNTAGGASWVSLHHGGGVGMGYSIHAGMVIVADGSPEAAARLARVLRNDPGMGLSGMRMQDMDWQKKRPANMGSISPKGWNRRLRNDCRKPSFYTKKGRSARLSE